MPHPRPFLSPAVRSSSRGDGSPATPARRLRSRIRPTAASSRASRAAARADIDAAVAAARAALDDGAAGAWGRLSAVERGRVLARDRRQGARATSSCSPSSRSHDVGKPLKQARADAVALARYCEFYGGACDKVHGETLPFANGYTALTLREPHGVTGHIVPWNYPMQIVGRSVGAALAMGNACVLKPAEEACLTVLAFARICAEAGLPAGALNVVTGLGEEAGAALSAHPGVDHLSFTGSVGDRRAGPDRGGAERGAGDARARRQEPADRLRRRRPRRGAAVPRQRRHPERRADLLGGVAHPGRAAGVRARCAALMAERYRALRVGPAARRPRRRPGDLGAARSDGVEHFLGARARQRPRVRRAKARSSPTRRKRRPLRAADAASTTCRPTHALAQDEIFGPVQVLIAFDGEAEAIAHRQRHEVRPGRRRLDRATAAAQLRMARALQCGQVFVNNYGAGGGIELPFGGVKHSGHGREKGFEALYGFSTLKTIAIHHG